MRAVSIKTPGGPEALEVVELPLTKPKENEVLIKVVASGVNRPDVAQRKGLYPPPPGASEIPGLEIAGTIVEIGSGVSRWVVGDKVCALVSGGGYAEYCPAPEGQCLPIPENLSFVEAASLPETLFTVWSNVWDRGQLKSGESLLIHGGSSGIGVAAIQMAKALGNTVYVTAGSDEKCKFCEELGATAINYKTTDFKDAILQATNGKGVNVILDMVGGDYIMKDILALADDGRVVIISTLNGKESQVDLSVIMRKRLTITGSTLRARHADFKSEIARNLEKQIWPFIKSGQIKPIIFKTFPVDKAAEAHQLMESSAHMGKIVLTW